MSIGRAMRHSRIGRAVAGMLVLALLVLAALPAAAFTPPDEHSHHAALGHGAHGADAAPVQQGQPPDRHGGTHAALACCVAMHCPMLMGSLPGAPAQPLPPAGLLPVPAAVRQLPSLSVLPALPPPRAAV